MRPKSLLPKDVEVDELLMVWLDEMSSRKLLEPCNISGYRASCRHDYELMRLTAVQLQVEVEACKDAAQYFEKRGAAGCAQRARLRAEAAEAALLATVPIITMALEPQS